MTGELPQCLMKNIDPRFREAPFQKLLLYSVPLGCREDGKYDLLRLSMQPCNLRQ